MISFASDNNSGIHPTILKAISEANEGHQVGYGDDPYTKQLKVKFSELFGQDIEMALVFNGTGANVIGLQSAAASYHSIICAETAHINVDECGAPEKMTGSKLVALPSPDGKLTPALIKPQLHGFDDEHHSQPKVISITQTTEMGTVYTIAEIKALAELAHSYDMYLHVDGARIANAVAYLNTDLKTLITDTSVDFMSFGGTK
ncbi:MAG: beta-eliminating lyase-related protein, partial [Bacteroidales bacterium]|nr:beta-eliminating lyase-related protein [Bacteroidales bacterium]